MGLALLVTVIEIDGNLRRQFMAALPERAPAFFFLDIPPADAGRFDDVIRRDAPGATLERVPMLRGRIVAANGVPVEALKPAASAAWVLQSDRGITYADEVPAGSRVVEGEWWKPDDQGPPLVSFEKKVADGLGLKLGDTVTVNVLGRVLTARIANLRALDWQSLGINFVMVFSPGSFRGAPHTDIATLTYPGGSTSAQEIALLKALADDFPAVTAVRVRDALDAVGHVVTNLVLGLRGATALTLVVALLVLGGRAGGRPPQPGARRGGAQGAGRQPRPAAWRLCARISSGRRRDRGVRHRGRIGRRRPGAHPGDEPVVRLAPGTGVRRRRRRHRGDGAAGAGRHLCGARPETGAGAAQPLNAL